ncbi:TIGR03089 family protein [Corynebacterium falsenii]|uniref:TIGR03089 family protein n=1 Tax=Corynebacterium falsenii TaxID=108486 RepID=UPI001CCDD1FC|nr:TIGR03089 family protein [Corynebacterium falsenii]UBI07511.1 TIGR03089 family protein [Corynebacterium falsenii]
MDLIAPLLATDPAAPRLTTYTDAGRMELSAQTLGNWMNKVANLLAEVGAEPGDIALVDCAPSWQPIAITLGCWRAGVSVTCSAGSAESAESAEPMVAFCDDLATAENLIDGVGGVAVDTVFLVSTDPFGRGVEESGGDVPFGIQDFSPELRVQPDAYLGSDNDGHDLFRTASGSLDWDDVARLAEPLDAGARVIVGGWQDELGLAQVIAPLFADGSVVMTTDTSPDRVAELAQAEKTTQTGY